MATRLVFLCEVCLDAGVETTGAKPMRLGVDAESALVDLCTDHVAQYVAPVLNMIREMGRDEHVPQQLEPVAKSVVLTPMSPNYYPCPGCIGTGRAPFGSASGLAAHIATAHGWDMSEMHKAVGRCRVRDCPGCERPAKNTQEIAQHVRVAHGYANVAVMLHELARSDPATVVDVIDRLLVPVDHDESDQLLTLLEVRS
jgi:hypothetical protein